MGGNLFSGMVERKPLQQHLAIVSSILDQLPQSAIAKPLKYIEDKTTFGDADILIDESTMSIGEAVDWIVSKYPESPVNRNSNILSFIVKHHQIDFIITPHEYFQSSLDYFANNDAGNLFGRVFHKLGFKYGHKGLLYCLRDGEKLIAEILVSQDQEAIMDFGGWAEYKNSFRSSRDLFEYVSTSVYFDPNIYLLNNRNYASRSRDAKRKTYMDFLKYCKDNHFSSHVKVCHKDNMLALALNKFPKFAKVYYNTLESEKKRKELASVFNGNLVMQYTDKRGKELGKLIDGLKSAFSLDELKLDLQACINKLEKQND